MMGRRDRILSLITVAALVVLPGALFVYYEHERRNADTPPATAPAPTRATTTTRAPTTTVRGFVTPTTPTNPTTTAPTTTTRATTTTARKGADLVGLAEPERRQTTAPAADTDLFEFMVTVDPVLGRYSLDAHYEVGRALCEGLDAGGALEPLAFGIYLGSPDDWDTETVSYFVGAAVAGLCPEHSSILEGVFDIWD